ncbi:UBX domain-containing protein 1 [Dendroctonus ponderosae]|uniref:UBX domain-containing protein n=1 Tax=Dendroctonus ponderosae TaxID=77166 RepID=A0AAR5Q016_DENPD|nr:UBX domain-containing protein 1 [Dendroctonus ponderosae]
MSSLVNMLVDMGFEKERVETAVAKTGSADVQVVMDWMLANEEEPAAVEPNPMAQPEPEAAPAALAKSIKCDDCGKLFNSSEEVEFHASKSGHGNFSESTEEKKPLSEEEKKEQLAKIEAKLRQRRLEREAREKEEALERERARIKSGKDMLEAKKRHDELEMKKIIEQRRREKEDELKAKQRVREQIQADKLARKAKQAGQPQEAAPTPPVLADKRPPQDYSEVKLQIRLIDGKTLSQSFGAKEPLSAVRLYIEMNRTDGDGPFKLMTSFPRKVFSTDDYDKPLDTLGLAPTATLIVSKS